MMEVEHRRRYPAESFPLDAPRYVVYGEVASGGTASVHYGQLRGPHGFCRAVAIKRLHPHIAKDPDFIAMFIDEARLSARLSHANIINTLDVMQTSSELSLVMEYVHGESLWTLLRLARQQGKPIPLQVASSLIASVLHGLHAAHEARDERGELLQVVHRDVSPPNILVGSDGIPRLLDFGIAKALGRMRSTPSGEIKGKLAYMAPEQLHATHVDRRTDVYGAAAVFWETLTGSQLFAAPSEPEIVQRVLNDKVEAPSVHRNAMPSAVDAIVLRGLQRDMNERFPTAIAMALELERSVGLATQAEIATWLKQLAGASLRARSERLDFLRRQAAPGVPRRVAYDGEESATRRLSQAPLLPLAAAADSPPPLQQRDAVHPGTRKPSSQHWLAGATVLLLPAAAVWAVSASKTQVDAAEHAGSAPAEVQSASAAAADYPPQHEPALDPVPQERAYPAAAAAAQIQDRVEPFKRSARPASEAQDAPPRAARHATTPPAVVKAKAKPQPQPLTETQPVSCAPFYYVDQLGIRHPKPECL
jgi:serine/threonine-protein kinase